MVLWTLACTPLLWWPVLCLVRGPVRSMRAGAWVCHVWARGLLRVLGVVIDVQGPEPPHGAFLVSNHVSWLDILVLAAWQPTNFVAKQEVAQIPAIGFLSRFVGTLFLNRESRRDAHRLAGDLRRYLADGAEITLFPEGYCADGHRLLPFKPSLLGAAAELGTPCVPVALSYDLQQVVWNDGSTAAAHAGRLMKARRLDRGRKPIRAKLVAGPAIIDRDRKQLTRRLAEEIAANFTPFAPPSVAHEPGARHSEIL